MDVQTWLSSCGRYSSDDAKMTGMTPAWLTFSGMYVEVPPYIRRPIMRLAYCTGIRRWACSTNTTPTMISRPAISTATNVVAPRLCRIWLPWAGSEAAIEVKISTDMPLPMPRSVISSPSHMITAVPAVIVTTSVTIRNTDVASGMILLVAAAGTAGPLRASATMPVDCRIAERDREVAGVLRELGLAGLALLLQPLQPGDHHDQQLHDDAARDVRHDPEREHRQLQQRAAAEQVDQAVSRSCP